MFSSSLLKWLVSRSFLFPNLISIFITNDLNSLYDKLLIYVSLFFYFSGVCSFALSMESSSSAFSFCLAFPVSVNLDETVTCFGSEEVFLCGSVLVRPPRAQCLFWESRVWCGCQPRLCSGCAGSCHVGEGAGLEMEELGLQPAVRHSVCSAQWLSPPRQGQGCSQLAGVEALRVRLELTLCPLQCVFPSPHSGIFAPKEESTEEVGLVCSDHSSICSLAPTHPTISSFLLLWPPQI